MPVEPVEGMPETTAEECVRKAWKAILRGDYAERDRLCGRAKVLIELEQTGQTLQ